MMIGWLCPFVHMPGIVVGAVIEAFGPDGITTEYIPVILPETPIGIAIQRGPLWVLKNLAGDFFSFASKIQAEGFLYDTFEAHQRGTLSVAAIERLLDVYEGEPRKSSDYGLVMQGGPFNLN